MTRISILCAALLLAGCATRGARPVAIDPLPAPPPVLLVSIDGFRWDFLDRTATPNLDRLAAAGVRAERLIPSFPSKTFPNHYTLVTGLYPGHHGVIANNIWDPVFEARFGLGLRGEVANGRWYGGEPIWVTAERAGLPTSPMFWPGSEAEIDGVRPTYVDRYDGDMPNRERIDLVLERLTTGDPRPVFATLYFSLIDDAAHTYNPDDAPEVTVAIEEADALVGYLLDGLERSGIGDRIHLFVVSDHGMAANSPTRAILLDDFIDLEAANVVDWNPVAALWPEPEAVEPIYEALVGAHPSLAVYRRDEIPERFHYRHRRTPPILAVADDGWVITSRQYLERRPGSYPAGNHGYDPELVSMGALFIAAGPGLRSGEVVAPFENVHVHALMCHLLELEPAPADSDLGVVRHLLEAGGSGAANLPSHRP